LPVSPAPDIRVAGTRLYLTGAGGRGLIYLQGGRFTEPIDELSAAAERVMEGDLEVEITVREGEEFEGLKRVFRDMVDSIKRMIERSMEG